MIFSFKYINTIGQVSSHPSICPDNLQDPPGHAVGQVFQVGSQHLKVVEKTKHFTNFSQRINYYPIIMELISQWLGCQDYLVKKLLDLVNSALNDGSCIFIYSCVFDRVLLKKREGIENSKYIFNFSFNQPPRTTFYCEHRRVKRPLRTGQFKCRVLYIYFSLRSSPLPPLIVFKKFILLNWRK